MKRALVATQKDRLNFIDIRVPGFDEMQESQCASYDFSLRDIEQPGSGSQTKCF